MPDSLLAFEEFQLDPGTGTLFRQGVPVPLAYRALLLLTALAQQSGHVVSKTDLMDAAWPGMAIEEGNLSVQIATLRKVLGPTADGGEMILTVPRVGYRFSPPVQRLPETNGQPSNTSEPEPPVGPSLAVLPFANLSDDPEQQYFADGLAEDIITQLSRLRWLFLSARNSSFTYQAKAVDVKQVGRELGVRYVLGGSVRRSGQRLRVTAQLSETTAGTQVWADRYESEIADFFALQDEITASVIAAIEPQLYAAEHKRLFRKPPESLDAWGHVMRAMPHVWTWGSSEDIDMAQSSLEKALAIDPGYAKAGSLLAWTYAARAHLGWVEPEPILAKAGAMAERAVQADPLDAWTHFSLGYVHMVSRRFGPAIEELTEATKLNPSLALAHVIMASAFGYNAMADAGLGLLGLAHRLSPRDYMQAASHSTAGLCHLMAGRYAEAATSERKAVLLRPHFVTAWRTLAAAAGLAGDLDVAREALSRSRILQPSLSLDWIERYHPIVQSDHRRLYCEGLRIAGLE